ncbi:MAG: N-methyl-L-tryptophan oxidase [Proteobacteria bacterium]|nr:N-methyl-L-tryptophan oxidase [Pseudomonadota bacterium]
MSTFDAIVVGLGAMGSATAYQLAKRGARVLGIDQFSPPHDMGSSHGDTRITRLGVGEGLHYTPLVMRSHEIWRALEAQTGETLLTANGGLIISSRGHVAFTHVADFFDNTLSAAKKFGIAHEILNAGEIRKRFPLFKVRDSEIGYYEPGAGFLRPEKCIRVQLDLARKLGADIRTNERLISFEASRDSVQVTTDRGAYDSAKLVLAVGPWLSEVLGERFARHFKIYRQTLFWFETRDSIAPFLPERFPVFIWALPENAKGIYGFPAIDGPRGGVKIASEQYEATATPQSSERSVSSRESEEMYVNLVAPHIESIGNKCLKAASCLYTVTADAGFVIDRHPDHESVLIASPCSGHGFKHSAAIGEALTQWALDGKTDFDLSAFGLARFT